MGQRTAVLDVQAIAMPTPSVESIPSPVIRSVLSTSVAPNMASAARPRVSFDSQPSVPRECTVKGWPSVFNTESATEYCNEECQSNCVEHPSPPGGAQTGQTLSRGKKLEHDQFNVYWPPDD